MILYACQESLRTFEAEIHGKQESKGLRVRCCEYSSLRSYQRAALLLPSTVSLPSLAHDRRPPHTSNAAGSVKIIPGRVQPLGS